MKMNKTVAVLVLILSVITVINSCGGGGGGGVSVTPGPGPGPSGSTTTVSGAVRLSSTLGKPGLGKAGIFEAVLSASTGTPLDNAIVEMYDADHPEWVKPVASALTGATGSYKLDVLANASLNAGATYTDGGLIPAGNYTLVAHKFDIDSGRTYIAVQGYVKHFAGNVTGQDLETQNGTTVPEVQSMFGLEKNIDGTFGSASYILANNAAVQTTFNTAMARKRLVDALSIKDGSTTVPGTWKVSADLQSATFYSSATLTIGTIYTVMVSGGTNTVTDPTPAISLYSIPMLDRVIGTFQAGAADNVNPTAIKISPATSSNVLIGTPIQIASDDPLDLNTFVITSSPSIGDKPSVKYAGTTSDWGVYKFAYTIVPDTKLLPDTSYNIGVSGSKDLAGNPLNALNFSFGTESAATVPVVSLATPTGTNASVKALVKAKFGSTIDPATVTDSNVLVTQGTATGSAVTGLVTFKNNEAIFTPASDLAYSTKYTARITTGIKSLWNIPLAADYSWSFTTSAPPDNTPPTTTASPAGGTYGAAQNVILSCNDNGGSGCTSIYYTTNGTEPTTSSATYVSAIPVSTTTTLKFFAKDVAGNSEIAKAEVYTIDLNPPVTTASPAAGTFNSATNVTLTADKAGSTIYYTMNNSTPTTSSPVYSAPISLPVNTATTLRYFAVDTYNHSETPKSGAYTVDTLPPSGSFTINGGATRSTSGALSLSLSATDNLTSVTQMAFSNDNFSTQVLSSYATSTTWNVIGEGTKTVYVKFRDGAGNWSSPISSSIIVDTTKPTVLSTSPTAMATNVDIGTTITATFSEDMDASTINLLNVTVFEGANQVFGPVSFDQTTRTATFTPSSALGYGKVYTATIINSVKDLAGNIMATSKVWTFTTKAAPSVPETVATPVGGIYSGTSVTVTLTATSSGSTPTIYYTTDNSAPTTGSLSFSGSGSLVFTSATTTLRYFSAVTGTSESPKVQVYKLDSAAPTGTISINAGAAATNSVSVTLTLSASDANGVTQMKFSNDNWSTESAPEAYNTTKSWILPVGDNASKIVYVKFKDAAGNWSISYSDFIALDTVAPVISAGNVGNSATSINTQSTNVYTSAADAAPSSTITDIMTSESLTFAGASWTAYTSPKAITLSAGQGNKTVYWKVRDAAGNSSNTWSDSIYYDATDPNPASSAMTINNGAAATIYTSATLYVYPLDVGPIQYYRVSTDNGVSYGGWLSYSGNWNGSLSTLPVTLPAGDGLKTVRVQFQDYAGNSGAGYASDSIYIDTVKPTGSMSINNGAVATNNLTMTLNSSVSDTTTWMANMETWYKVGTGSWVYNGYETYSSAKAVTVPAGDNTITMGGYFYDAAGNYAGFLSDTIILDQTAPAYSSSSPASCSTVAAFTPVLYQYLTESGSGIDPATVNATTVKCYDSYYNGTPIACGGPFIIPKCPIFTDCSNTQVALWGPYLSGNTVYFASANTLVSGQWHFCTMSGIKDKAGNALPDTTYRFLTQ